MDIEIGGGSVRNYTLRNLEENSDYIITLTAIRRRRRISSHFSAATTDDAGKLIQELLQCCSNLYAKMSVAK